MRTLNPQLSLPPPPSHRQPPPDRGPGGTWEKGHFYLAAFLDRLLGRCRQEMKDAAGAAASSSTAPAGGGGWGASDGLVQLTGQYADWLGLKGDCTPWV